MNVLIRRLGIVIKSIPITGDRARVGSGDECEICLSDPYLAPVVAELVRRDGEWYIVDSGSSLEGIRRGEDRVVEEVLEPGEPYVVGGFEIVREGSREELRTRPGAQAAAPIPQTMFQARIDPLPGTVVQSLDEVRASGKSPAKGGDSATGLAFQRIATGSGISPVKEPKSRIRLILLVAAVMFAGLFLLVIITSSRKPAPASTPVVDTVVVEPAPEPIPTTPAVPSGDQAAMVLDLENAFAGWEAELARKEDPELRRKIVTGALEIGRVYAAAGDPRAKSYLERVVRYGDAESAEVTSARERLEVIRN